jgi:glutamate racemase
MNASAPLGIFDSGIGGLTVVRTVRRRLPNESIIYLGDTARLPYGNKSPETIRKFSQQICDVLLQRKVKAIVVACNTASAHALIELQKKITVPIFGVIRPGVEAALRATKNGRVGIIGTSGTIRSGAYQELLIHLKPKLHLIAAPTPLLVSLVEENWLNHKATRLILEEYLVPFKKEKVDTLVLACTHYPLLKRIIQEIMGKNVQLVDSAAVCANYLQEHLETLDQLNPSRKKGKMEIILSDKSPHFQTVAERFLREKISSMKTMAW